MENNNNKGKKLLERDGFYLVLFLCVCLVALTAVWVTKNSIDNLATEKSFVQYEDANLEDENKGKVAKNEDEIHLIKENQKTIPTSTKSKQNLATAKQDLEKQTQESAKQENTEAKSTDITERAIMPIQGNLIRGYSESEPSYSTTLEQWELHKAIDIKCKEGTPVKAAMSGEVTQVTKDDKNGITIKIKHPNNLITVYSNLASDAMVKVGQKVNKSDVISNLGNTSVVESNDGAHLHFEALKDGKNIDPLSIIK